MQRRETFYANGGQATSTTQIQEKFNSKEGQATSTANRREKVNSNGDQATSTTQIQEKFNSNEDQATSTTKRRETFYTNGGQATSTTQIQEKFNNKEGLATSTMQRRERINSNGSQASNTTQIQDKFNSNEGPASNSMQRQGRFNRYGRATNFAQRPARAHHSDNQATILTPYVAPEIDRTSIPQTNEPQNSGRDSTFANYRDIIEDLMQTHDVFLSTLRSRLTKLQVVRHFWERKDIKGAISAMRKLPDTSVQADVISVLTEKMEILNLDLFSWLLPVLVGLLESKMERHTKVSLDMLLKLVAVFGPVIHSTISAPPAVGIDLQAEQRRECCNQCFIQLQKIQKILPLLVRRGGLIAKCAQELNLVLRES